MEKIRGTPWVKVEIGLYRSNLVEIKTGIAWVDDQ